MVVAHRANDGWECRSNLGTGQMTFSGLKVEICGGGSQFLPACPQHDECQSVPGRRFDLMQSVMWESRVAHLEIGEQSDLWTYWMRREKGRRQRYQFVQF